MKTKTLQIKPMPAKRSQQKAGPNTVLRVTGKEVQRVRSARVQEENATAAVSLNLWSGPFANMLRTPRYFTGP